MGQSRVGQGQALSECREDHRRTGLQLGSWEQHAGGSTRKTAMHTAGRQGRWEGSNDDRLLQVSDSGG